MRLNQVIVNTKKTKQGLILILNAIQLYCKFYILEIKEITRLDFFPLNTVNPIFTSIKKYPFFFLHTRR